MIDRNGWKKALLKANESAASVHGLSSVPSCAIVVTQDGTDYVHLVHTGAGMVGLKILEHGCTHSLTLKERIRELSAQCAAEPLVFLDQPRPLSSQTQRQCALIDTVNLFVNPQVVVPYDMP